LNARLLVLVVSERIAAALLIGLVMGAALGFGGAVWWFRPAFVIGASLLGLTILIRNLATGEMPLLRSPLGPLGMLALALGIAQLLPMPPKVAEWISPTAHELYARGVFPNLAQADDSEAIVPEATQVRSPATLDRSATLRWLVQAAGCLTLFWAVSQFVDRLGRLYLVWGLVVGAFFLNAAFGLVQVVNRTEGLYGLFLPGSGPWWTPGVDDLLNSPATASLRHLSGISDPEPSGGSRPIALVPTHPFLFGTMMGGGGAFLAMGSLSMPLGLAIVAHLVSPRGSRESLFQRLGQAGQGSLVILLTGLLAVSGFLTGLFAGPWHAIPLVMGLAVTAFPAGKAPGARGPAAGLAGLLITGLILGIVTQLHWSALLGGEPPVSPPEIGLLVETWTECHQVIREFPFVGAGLGCFASVHPYFKNSDLTTTTATSSVHQWGVESGVLGLCILIVGACWCLWRIPGSLRSLGAEERSLAHGLVGAGVSLSLLAMIHWTLELPAVAVSASVLGGTWNRWLAGGTDLFVERA